MIYLFVDSETIPLQSYSINFENNNYYLNIFFDCNYINYTVKNFIYSNMHIAIYDSGKDDIIKIMCASFYEIKIILDRCKIIYDIGHYDKLSGSDVYNKNIDDYLKEEIKRVKRIEKLKSLN